MAVFSCSDFLNALILALNSTGSYFILAYCLIYIVCINFRCQCVAWRCAPLLDIDVNMRNVVFVKFESSGGKSALMCMCVCVCVCVYVHM